MNMENEFENVCFIADMTRDFALRHGASQAQADICARVLERQPEGSVCIEVSKNERQLLKEMALVSMAPDDHGLFILDGALFYTRRNWKYERYVKERILEMADVNEADEIHVPEESVYAALKKCQRHAIELMCKRHFSILTGGPGTGKTYTIARAVKLMQDMDPTLRIGIAAPTGKAASRVGEAMKQEAQELQLKKELETCTIHTLLGSEYDFVTFKHNKSNPLELDWLIVDEASMIDLPLMAKMLMALPNECRLTLVGDANQLASVELGRVFGDLCRMPHLEHCIAQLNESSRFPQGGEIDRLSEAIKNGDEEGALAVLRNPGNELIHFHSPNEKERLHAVVKELFGRNLAQQETSDGALKYINDCRILCALRKGPFGCEQLNEDAKRLLGDKCPIPAMITKNNRSLFVSNGDIGVIMPRKLSTFSMLNLEGQAVDLPCALLTDREMAFATTIHKSQGSEYQDVIIVLPPDEAIGAKAASLLTREILYTAITRTKGQVFIFADENTVRHCCRNEIKRVTGL